MVDVDEHNRHAFAFDACLSLRLSHSDVVPVHIVAPPTKDVNSYLVYVLKFGPILSNSFVAKMQGAVFGKVFQTGEFIWRYCKAPGKETVALFDDANRR